jgi:hypothetical protein
MPPEHEQDPAACDFPEHWRTRESPHWGNPTAQSTLL